MVEFPIAMLSSNPSSSLKTLRFADRLYDRGSGNWMSREVIVTAADAFGLPTHFDMDVLLSLMVITQDQNGFRERTVEFSLYQIVESLSLKKFGGLYDRIRLSLDRWCGTTVKFENAWRANDRWSTETFHFLDNVKLTKSRDFAPNESQVFKWNDVIVESVQRQHTKPFDWSFYKSLSSPTARRIFRFLDKRFFHKNEWEFEVEEFVVNKLGLQGGQRLSKYNQKLREGIEELESAGFLARGKSCVEKKSKGVFFVSFVKAKKKATIACLETKAGRERGESDRGDEETQAEVSVRKTDRPQDVVALYNDHPLVTKLVQRGVSRLQALELVQSKPDECQRQVNYFDFQKAAGWQPSKSSGGYLRTAIVEGYSEPDGYKAPEELAKEKLAQKKKHVAALKAKEEEAQKIAAERMEFKRREALVLQYRERIGDQAWKSLIRELAEPYEAFHRRFFLSSDTAQVNAVYEKKLSDAHSVMP